MTESKAKTPKGEPTEYVVLEQIAVAEPSAKAWIEVDRLTARGGNEATLLRKWGEAGKHTGTFKLCPARSWAGGIRLFEQTSMASEPIA